MAPFWSRLRASLERRLPGEFSRAMRTTRRLDWDRHRAGQTIFHDGRRSRRGPLHFVDSLYQQKDTERDDEKINRNRNKIAVGEDWPQFFRIRQGQSGRDFFG